VEATPFRGFVVAVAWDITGTYLLYIDSALRLRISKRQADGTYIQGRLLSTTMGPDGSLSQGDVVASGGRWWATWREHVRPGGGPGDEFDQTELFQAYTIGGTYSPRERVTSNPAWDSAPSLALTPATTFPVRLVWARGGSDFEAAIQTCGGPLATRTQTGSRPAWPPPGPRTSGPTCRWPGGPPTSPGTGTAARCRPTTPAGRS